MSTPYHSQYWALLLTAHGASGTVDRLARSIAGARVDLNPHQVDAALFALRSPVSRGVILADEVGLGKTIEAGLVIAQRWAERRRCILVIVPAILRSQWQEELEQKFFLPTLILDSRSAGALRRPGTNPFDLGERVVVCSYHFASSHADEVGRLPWDLVVIDEAHRMRNVYKPGSRIARRIADAVRPAPKLLLTATPLQNSLMELYGLVSVIDEQVFGDDAVFREAFMGSERIELRHARLRERLQSLCVRTLRKQVSEYVAFTRRIPITQEFSPSDDEQTLYDTVSAYLQREDLHALPASQRNLITLVLRKLLASSTFAIGPTLNSLADRLERAAPGDELFDDLDLEGVEELSEELGELEGDPADLDQVALAPEAIRSEVDELRRYAALAERIRVNAKGEALVPALEAAFTRARGIGAPEKVIVFTESRRTQSYLFDLLSRRGFEGLVATLNGTNGDAESRRIYEGWLARRSPTAPRLSRGIGTKSAIVDHFRDHASILVATEAAAEGVNLQFCSLVVNFDLPWNPQRIEQRIGRCHRYGQKHDVVVVNFLNRRNAADQRVFQLLRDKFRLFDGVFGASDEVLGALESGVDVERRIAAVYQQCRTAEAIEVAFDRLQADLEDEIRARMSATRASLLEHFDQEVAERLRVHRDRTVESLDQRGRWLLELSRTELGSSARFETDQPRFELLSWPSNDVPLGFYHFDWKKAERLGDSFYRQDHPLAEALVARAVGRRLEPVELAFEYPRRGTRVSALEPLIGNRGWLALGTLTVESVDTSEFVLLAAEVETKHNGAAILDAETCQKLLALPAHVRPSSGPFPDPMIRLEECARTFQREVEQRNACAFDEEVGKLDRWSADLKDGLERELKDLDRRIREASREAVLAQELAAKIAAQRAMRALDGERNKKRRELFEAQDEIDRRREELIAGMEKQLACRSRIAPRFVVRWTLA